MKRMRILPLLTVLCLLLAACGNSADTTAAPGESQSGTTAAAETEPTEPEGTLPAKGGCTMQVLTFERDGKKIYGELYLPEGNGPFACVIIGHGLSSGVDDTRGYAEYFAQYGIAAYAFDFIGGGPESHSDGDPMEMSILTEAADMKAVLKGILALDAVDKSNVFLMGCSQGGFVATYAGAKNAADVKGLVLFYPAYILQDDVKERTLNGYHITEETSRIMDIPVGEIYIRDALSFSIFEVMKDYGGSVLIIQGTEDEVTPLYYAQRAQRTMPNAELILIEGAMHGFLDEEAAYAAERAALFIRRVASR